MPIETVFDRFKLLLVDSMGIRSRSSVGKSSRTLSGSQRVSGPNKRQSPVWNLKRSYLLEPFVVKATTRQSWWLLRHISQLEYF